MKYPEHARSCDMQVKEMEEMKFSRKLTEKEKSKWKGPVHHVPHHAVLRLEKREHQSELYLTAQHQSKGIC